MEDKNQASNQNKESDQALLSWRSQEATNTNLNGRGVGGWFWFGVILVATYAVWQRQWILLATLVVASIVWVLFRRAIPQELTVTVTAEGIGDGNRFWKFGDLLEFAVDESEIPHLKIRHKSKFSPDLIFIVHPDSVEDVKKILGQFLPEKPIDSWLARFSQTIGL